MHKPQTRPATDRILVEMSRDHYHRILRYANAASPVYFRLKNSVTTESGTLIIPCDAADAEMLLGVAKHFCPGAVAKIESAIAASRSVVSAQTPTIMGGARH